MAIATSTAVGAPFAKLTELGDRLVGALCSDPSKSRRQRQNYETRQPMWRDDGKPMLEEVLHLVAMPATTARTGDADRGYEVIQPGTHVRYSLAGFKWGQVIDARKNLPARGPIAAGRDASGDVYEIALVGWSAETKNAGAAQAAGFTVVEGRIILRTQEDKDRYVLAQSRQGGNTNPAKDITVTVRRPTDAEATWEAQADEVFGTRPWEFSAATATEGASADGPDDGPFPAAAATGPVEAEF